MKFKKRVIYFFNIKFILKEGDYPIIPEQRLREIPLDKWLSFVIYFEEKIIFLCRCNFIFCVYFAENFILGRIRKVAIQEHINKTNSQNRRNLNSTNLQTKSTASENSVSTGSWHVALRKCKYIF